MAQGGIHSRRASKINRGPRTVRRTGWGDSKGGEPPLSRRGRGGHGGETPSKGFLPPCGFLVTFCPHKKSPGVWGWNPHKPSNGMVPIREKKMFLPHPPGDRRISPASARCAGTEVSKTHFSSVSNRMVTGPSFSEATSMSAPNSPCWTSKPRSRHRAINLS